MKSIWQICLFLTFHIFTVYGQDRPELPFVHLTTKDGLPTFDVHHIAQDSKGFIWLATAKGLVRYDGSKFVTFDQDDKIFNLSFSNVFNLYITDNDVMYTIINQRLTSRNLNDPQKVTDWGDVIMINKGEQLYFVKKDSKKAFFIHSNNKIDSLSLDIFSEFNTNMPYNAIVASKNKIIATHNQYIHIFDKVTKKAKQIVLSKHFTNFNTIVHDKYAYMMYWNKPILRLDLQDYKIDTIEIGDKLVTVNGVPWTWQGKKYMVFGGFKYIILFDLETQKSYFYPMPGTNTVYVDRQKNLWSTDNISGLHMVPHFTNLFSRKEIEHKDKDLPIYMYKVKQMDSLVLVSMRYNQGAMICDRAYNIIHKLDPPRLPSLPNLIQDVYDVHKYGNQWVGTTDYGLISIDLKSGSTKTILHYGEGTKFRNIIPWKNNKWLIRTVPFGIFLYDPDKNQIEKIYKTNDTALTMIENRDNHLYVLGDLGLYVLDEKRDSFILIANEIIKKTTPQTMVSDKYGRIWVAGFYGVCMFDPKTNKALRLFGGEKFIHTISYLAIEGDELAIIMAEGILFYDIETGKRRYIHQSINPDIKMDNFNLDINGDKSILSQHNHLYTFDYQALQNFKENNQVFITSIYDKDKEWVYEISQNRLSLHKGVNSIFVQLSSPSYMALHNIDYYYKINSDSIWSKLKGEELFLPSLTYGTLKLQYKAINKTTGEETLAKQIDITVPPYWYQTLWFRMLVIAIVGGLVYLFYRWRLIENEKRVILTQAYEKKLLKSEIDNIRSQMNPHFMFNALNSIKRYVVENQPEIASDYISKFSRLMRLILENSKHEYVNLENELEALILYLMMEESRFGNNFKYEIVVEAGNENVEELLIPPLIIQPYVENAIWHGLQQKDGLKKLEIYIKLEDNQEYLSIIVQDNGIGRKKSMELRSKSSTKKKSFGMEATLMRLKFYNELNDVAITDLYDAEDQASGTKVTLRFLLIHP